MTVDQVYTPENTSQDSYLEKQGLPGEYPYLRGVHASGYRGRLWTMRMFAGFGLPEETNARFKFLMEQGQTGLSVAFDMPTLYGYDTDDPRGAGEFGTCGVAVSSLADMETLFEGIKLDQITTSMTINSPAAIIWAMYIALAEKQGASLDQLGGTIQNDILKEFIAQNEYIFPPEPSMRLVTDTVEYATRNIPRWNPISISGYHIREAGSNAIQELAFTLADGFEYVRHGLERGLKIDEFAPRLSFFFNSHNNFFEEVGKFRAARRIWAREMQETFGAKDPRSHQLRFHAQTSGQTLTAQQPENNVVRVSFQAMAAVLGGCQSLHTNGKDEAWALPSEEAALQALRTQQIIAHETGITDTVDPLGGSYFVETMTNNLEEASYEYFRRIDDIGGVIPALETGFLQREIADASYVYQLEDDRKERITVGVNEYWTEEGTQIPLLRVDREGEKKQIDNLNNIRRTRDNREVAERLKALEQAARGSENTMPYLVEASKAYATLGEMMDVFRDVFGEYNPSWGY
ncbi:MAG: methylmalonyl-CoA mutase [SAR202 cluster bacterium]|nr:methylmalonyl-CoA mutase [SAR202 cluster bacterium]MQG64214.1 methylmalonyl-CoA mutase [SAR202 cluster bacterium]|tara:strand:+ start:803 stop:2359 length:1557 start_codon:yes stop_codon:yes gene_type:complete